MKIHKLYIAIGMVIAFALFFEFAAHADETDQATIITFSQPVQIPGKVLPAGSYLFKLAESDADLNVVQIFSADRTKLYATLQTVSTDRLEPTGNTMVALAEQGAGQPEVLLKWFYPGRDIGNEFLYSKHEEKELAQDKQHNVVADEPNAAVAADAAGN